MTGTTEEETNMRYADPDMTWTEWTQENADRDEPTRLLALREYIFALAEKWNGRERITADWLNKKLAKIGITERVAAEYRYDVETPVVGTLKSAVFAASRADALAKLAALGDGTRGGSVANVKVAGDSVFTSGPEDEDPTVVDPDAPTTVHGTLVMLRDIIMLGHIAGPKYCKDSANQVLATYGLDEIPPRMKFVVARPVEAVMTTTVEAYDLASAERVARWRWDNDRASYQLAGGEPTDEAAVTAS